MAEGREPEHRGGCVLLLAIPFKTLVIGVSLLIHAAGRKGEGREFGPYREPAPSDDLPRPLTPLGNRIVGTTFVVFTGVFPGALAVRGVAVYGSSVAGMLLLAAVVWVAMFVGHLVALKLFTLLEPRLPHLDS